MTRTIYLLVGILMLINGCTHVRYAKNVPKPGTVIVLNGPSAAGKSSIQRSFQHLMMPALWVKVGIDNLFDSPMPDITMENLSFWQKENPIRWVTTSQDSNGKTIVTLHVGEQGKNVAYAMNSAIAQYVSNGCNVIVDYIAYEQDWFLDLQTKLKSFKTYYVAVDISLEELERREAARKTSPVGHARSHYSSVYGDTIYDLRVNSERDGPDEIAKKIAQLVANGLTL